MFEKFMFFIKTRAHLTDSPVRYNSLKEYCRTNLTTTYTISNLRETKKDMNHKGIAYIKEQQIIEVLPAIHDEIQVFMTSNNHVLIFTSRGSTTKIYEYASGKCNLLIAGTGNIKFIPNEEFILFVGDWLYELKEIGGKISATSDTHSFSAKALGILWAHLNNDITFGFLD